MNVGAVIVHPNLFCPGVFAGGAVVEEENVGFDALGVEDAGGQTQDGVEIRRFKEFLAHGFACAPFKEDVIGDDDRGPPVLFKIV